MAVCRTDSDRMDCCLLQTSFMVLILQKLLHTMD